MSKSMLLKPRLSEKSYGLAETMNVYVFEVPASANRHSVARAVASQYEVTVEGVKIAKTAAKPLRAYKRRGRRSMSAQRPGVHKAYVTLKEGDKLPFYASSIETGGKPEESK